MNRGASVRCRGGRWRSLEPSRVVRVKGVANVVDLSERQAIVSVTSEDERAYDQCVRQIASTRQRLDAVRQELADLRRAMVRFEAACHDRVGDLLAELRRVQRGILDHERRLKRLETHPDDEELEHLLDDVDDIDDELDAAFHGETSGAGGSFRTHDARPRHQRSVEGHRQTEAEAKRLYRQLAKRCHPDFAADDPDRQRRVGLMQRVNEAYRGRDLPTLRVLFREAEVTDPEFALRPVSERLAWMRSDLVRLVEEIGEHRSELTALRASEAYRLWRRFEAGEPVLDTLEDTVERRLRSEGRRLDRLVATWRAARDERARDLGVVVVA